ncbi:MAG: ATP-binding protein [Roseburia sp.]|nr:ATP-binding protein [Roseburia sp.]MCM1096467.1 ATP-binding protein [Ruminococcus flavefaciens]
MGLYLNSKKPYLLFQEEAASAYFVDKTDILKELAPIVSSGTDTVGESAVEKGRGHKYICVTRPRRFGKTVMANMISAYFGKGADSGRVFGELKAASFAWYREHLNRHNVIHIMFNELPNKCTSYDDYMDRIIRLLREDLSVAYPNIRVRDDEALWDVFHKIVEFGEADKFIFVLDEWDFIFHRSFITESDKAAYLGFLSNLLKDQPYVELVYMTGILPIAKYSSGSELNMFYEYTMAAREKYSQYFGFTEEEVDEIYQRYLKKVDFPNVDREGLRLWYDGYQAMSGINLYNPRSVVGALSDNQLGNYWTSSGPYDEIFYYVERNVEEVRDDIAMMVSGFPVPAKVQEYAATSMKLETKDEIFSAMVVYGFLSYKDGYVSIPNKELMDKFAAMLRKEPSLGYVHRLAKESGKVLQATKSGDTKTVAYILEYVHNTESPLLSYSNEAELAAVVGLAYLEARDSYRVEREEKAGKGYVDFIFYPLKPEDDCIILELKVDHTAEEAVAQIKERNYALGFQSRLGERVKYRGRILAVGISYNRENKKHDCRIEVLREAI